MLGFEPADWRTACRSLFSRIAVARKYEFVFPLTSVVGLASAALAQGEVNIYSYRQPQLIDPLLKAFTDKTGIKANIVYAAAGLNERLAAEGQNSPADLLPPSTPAVCPRPRMPA